MPHEEPLAGLFEAAKIAGLMTAAQRSKACLSILTNEARQVMGLANEKARGLNHAYVGTEHILLG